MSDELKLQEIIQTLRECEIPEAIISQVISETNDPAEAFDRAFALMSQNDQSQKLLKESDAKKTEEANKLKTGEMKMVFLVRMDLKGDKKDLFSDVGSAGLIISNRMLLQGEIDGPKSTEFMGKNGPG